MGREPLEFLDNHPIDWPRIARAVAFYAQNGYQYVEVPWVVPAAIVRETLPEGGVPFRVVAIGGAPFDGELVGSAEQSFLWLERLKGREGKKGPFFAVSPCFRGDRRSQLRQKSFMKLELWAPVNPGEQAQLPGLARTLREDAKRFFQGEGAEPQVVDTTEGEDLYVAGIEVGSYGFRDLPGASWAYGTGLAEPRFSQAFLRQVRE